MSEQLQKVWLTSTVTEGGTLVFTKGGASNVRPGYSQFRLDLSLPAAVKLTEFDASTFSGTWEISTDQKTVILKNLIPQPTATNGIIEYTIGSVTDQDLTLTRKSASIKTGGTLNTYYLTN